MFRFLHPRYWLTWLGFFILWLVTWLPWHWQMQLGKGLGVLLFNVLPARRQVACINLAIAYPELSQHERYELNRRHFIAMAQGLIDSSLAWWHKERVIARSEVVGLDIIKALNDQGDGVILLAIHLSSLEITGALLSQLDDVGIVYRPHRNALINYLVQTYRRYYGTPIQRDNIRKMVRYLRLGKAVWYAPDQGSINKNSALSPFFGEPAMTSSATARIMKMTHAKLVTCVTYRILDDKGQMTYRLEISKPLTDFPMNNEAKSAAYLNRHFEQLINDYPEQYFWSHKRYKQPDYNFYQMYQNQHPNSGC